MTNPATTSPVEISEISLQKPDLDKQPLTDTSNKPVFYFGCGPCRPKWLQVFANAKFYTFILCLFVIVEGAITAGEITLHVQGKIKIGVHACMVVHTNCLQMSHRKVNGNY